MSSSLVLSETERERVGISSVDNSDKRCNPEAHLDRSLPLSICVPVFRVLGKEGAGKEAEGEMLCRKIAAFDSSLLRPPSAHPPESRAACELLHGERERLSCCVCSSERTLCEGRNGLSHSYFIDFS